MLTNRVKIILVIMLVVDESLRQVGGNRGRMKMIEDVKGNHIVSNRYSDRFQCKHLLKTSGYLNVNNSN